MCSPMVDGEPIINFLWIILKMRANTDIPYHPIICRHPKAYCVRDKFDCYYEKGISLPV